MSEDENEVEELGGIFTDEANYQNLRENAEALGINPDAVAPEYEEGTKQYFAKKGCKNCWGRGVFDFVISPSKQKLFYSKSRPYRLKKGRRVKVSGPTPKKLINLYGVAPGNDLGEQWDTRKPRPDNYNDDNRTMVLCKCVRAIEL